MAQRDRSGGRSRTGPAGRARPPAARPTFGPGRDLAAQRERIAAVVTPVVARAGLDLEELAVARAGRRYVLRVLVDGDGGVSLDAVADLSRLLSAALDEAEREHGEFASGEYVLEVSSPGTDRPLTQPRHWRRNVGRLVTVAVDGRPVTGRIVAADDAGVTLDGSGDPRRHGYGQLGPGRVQIEFSRLAEADLDGEDLDGEDLDGEDLDGEDQTDEDPDELDPDADGADEEAARQRGEAEEDGA